MSSPRLSVIVAFRNMAREAPRTLLTLSTRYQRHVNPEDYEVIGVDMGSTVSLTEEDVSAYGPQFRLIRVEDGPSPAPALNQAAALARGQAMAVCVDGARMLSPGIIRYTLEAMSAERDAVIATLAWHLGPKLQNQSMLDGYCQAVEDRLLQSVDWQSDGYELFRISCIAGSSKMGYFLPISESNFLTVPRSYWEMTGGLNEDFCSPGGGLVNLDFFREATEYLNKLVVLLGEGTFHQFHGGVATNVPIANHPFEQFHQEYTRIRGRDFAAPATAPTFIGGMPVQALPFLASSVASALAAQAPRP
jgi:hypothetical protein